MSNTKTYGLDFYGQEFVLADNISLELILIPDCTPSVKPNHFCLRK